MDGMPLTELEQSVSATLLQLAFDDDVLTDSKNNNGPKKKKRGSGDDDDDDDESLGTPKNQFKKKDSLLDDYEETPMEKRLRRVQYAS